MSPTNTHISTCFPACLQSLPSNHEEELTRVLIQHSPKSACAGLRRPGFLLAQGLVIQPLLGMYSKGGFLELLTCKSTNSGREIPGHLKTPRES